MRVVWATVVASLSLTTTTRSVYLRLLKTRPSRWRIFSAGQDTSPSPGHKPDGVISLIGARRGMSPRQRDDLPHEIRDKNKTTNKSNDTY